MALGSLIGAGQPTPTTPIAPTAAPTTPTASPAPSGQPLAQSGQAQLPKPPTSPEEEAQIKSEWEDALGRPEVQAALLQFAISIGQPIGPNDNVGSAALRAAGEGFEAAGRVQTQTEEAERLDEAAQLEQDKLEGLDRRAELTADTTLEAARIRSGPTSNIVTLNAEQKADLGINAAFLAQLDTLTGKIITTDQTGKVGGLKAVLDLEATSQTGNPVTRFATNEEITASKGNLVPPPRGIKIRVDPDTGLVEIATEGQTLPTQVRSRALQNITSEVNLLTNLGTLIDQVEAGGNQVIGPVGAVKDLINVTVASFIPALFSEDRARFVSQLEITREASKRAVSDEERFTEENRKYVQKLFPSPGVFTNKQEGLVKMEVMAAFFLRKLGPDLRTAGVDTANVPTLEITDLFKFAGDQLLTPEEVRDSVIALFPGQPMDITSVLSMMLQAGLSEEEMDPIIRQLFPGALQ